MSAKLWRVLLSVLLVSICFIFLLKAKSACDKYEEKKRKKWYFGKEIEVARLWTACGVEKAAKGFTKAVVRGSEKFGDIFIDPVARALMPKAWSGKFSGPILKGADILHVIPSAVSMVADQLSTVYMELEKAKPQLSSSLAQIKKQKENLVGIQSKIKTEAPENVSKPTLAATDTLSDTLGKLEVVLVDLQGAVESILKERGSVMARVKSHVDRIIKSCHRHVGIEDKPLYLYVKHLSERVKGTGL